MGTVKERIRWDLTNDSALAQAVRLARIPLCIADPNISDNPIVFANEAFLDLTGYSKDEVIGRNCRFLQGRDTTDESIASIRNAIEGRTVEIIEIINYRKDGSRFINSLQIGPIMDDDGGALYFFGSQLDVTAKRDAEAKAKKLADEELIHRLRNIVNVMNAIIRMSAQDERDPDALGSIITERLRALSDAHFQTIDRPEDENLDLSELAITVMLAYSPTGASQFNIEGPALIIPQRLVSCMALMLHELATNSVKHGSLSVKQGRVSVEWTTGSGSDGETVTVLWREENGPPVIEPERRSGSGIIAGLIEAMGGTMTMDWRETGLQVETVFPLS